MPRDISRNISINRKQRRSVSLAKVASNLFDHGGSIGHVSSVIKNGISGQYKMTPISTPQFLRLTAAGSARQR